MTWITAVFQAASAPERRTEMLGSLDMLDVAVHRLQQFAVNGAAVFLKSGAGTFPSLAVGDQPWG
jgi:hypothetical protein